MRNRPVQDEAVRVALAKWGITVPLEDARVLRLAARTLQRWHELECGARGRVLAYGATGNPYLIEMSTRRRIPTADRRRSALRRVERVCEKYGLYYYEQDDPRGAALWIAADRLNENNYSLNGIPVLT